LLRFALSVCRVYACCVLGHESGSLNATMLAHERCPLRLLGALLAASSPWVVLGPVVDAALPFLAIQKADFGEHAHEGALFPVPIYGQLDVLVGHAGEVTVAAVVGCPQEQADQLPGRAVVEAPDQLLCLGMPRQPSRYACVGCHLRPQSAPRPAAIPAATD
jgi:hypothetical protein